MKISLKEKILIAINFFVEKDKNLQKIPLGFMGGSFSFAFAKEIPQDELRFWISVKKSVFYSTVSRMVKGGLLIKTTDDKKIFLKITDKGRELLLLKFPHLFWGQEKWDGNWRVIVFDIPEKAREIRDKLRKYLSLLRSVSLSESLWVNPWEIFPLVENFARIYHIESYLTYILGRISERDGQKVVEKLKISEVNTLYQKLLEDLRKAGNLQDHDMILTLKSRFLEIYALDPHLPRRLLPKDWLGEKICRRI